MNFRQSQAWILFTSAFVITVFLTVLTCLYATIPSPPPRPVLTLITPPCPPTTVEGGPSINHNPIPPLRHDSRGSGDADEFIRERLLASERVYQAYMAERKIALRHPNEDSYIFHGQDYIWDYFRPTFSCPWTMQSLGWGGAGGGGKWVCGLELHASSPPCVVYSFGAEGDSSFEADILVKTPCSVFVFDGSKTGDLGPEIPFIPSIQSRITLTRKNIGVWDSGSTATLASAMAANGHTFIDILKMDVEGAEFDVLNKVLGSGSPAPFGQLALEVHMGYKTIRPRLSNFKDLLSLWERMEAAGLRAFHMEPNFRAFGGKYKMTAMEYAFINVKRKSRIVPSAI